MPKVCLMHVHGKSAGLLNRDLGGVDFVLNAGTNQFLEQLKLLAKQHLECLLLLIKHIVSQVCNIVLSVSILSSHFLRADLFLD